MFETEIVGPCLVQKLKGGVCPPGLPSGYARGQRLAGVKGSYLWS